MRLRADARPFSSFQPAAMKELPFNALPLSFTLLTSLSATAFSSPLPCLSVCLPHRPHPDDDVPAKPAVHDGGERAAVRIVRILDPEHR